MKLVQQRLIEDALCSSEPCLGAAFCSYTFDAEYFEDHVLRAILQLEGDPAEDALRFHEEARAALRVIPVACIIDGSTHNGGRRLPYDLHLVRGRTYHPKVYLALYEREARLAVGSGNLTRSGFEQNTELFFTRTLDYRKPADARMLRDVARFFRESLPLSHTTGTQLSLVLQSLSNRLRDTTIDEEAPADALFVSTFAQSMLEAIDEALPRKAKLIRVGVLAPFYEQDDLSAGNSDEGVPSVLRALAELRPSNALSVDLAVPWDNAPVSCPEAPLEKELDQPWLWAWKQRNAEHVESIEYLTLGQLDGRRLLAKDAHGATKNVSRVFAEQARADRSLWPVAAPRVFAPKTILHALAKSYPMQLWLHPSTQLDPQVIRRPLHAKVLTLLVREGAREFTLVLMGSANASKAALARTVAQRGNVEAGMLLRIDGDVPLHALLPALVACPMECVEFEERPAIEHGQDHSVWIREAVHDAEQQTLRVEWSDSGPQPLGRWSMRYGDDVVLTGDGVPTEPSFVHPFVLHAASAELWMRVGDQERPIPIRVHDLAALPVDCTLGPLGLRELLAILGRRAGEERINILRRNPGSAGIGILLEAIFGEGFGPTDVFKAWWGLAEDLRTATTTAAFRLRLHGPTSAGRVWSQLYASDEASLSRDEVWLYGCELLRELTTLELARGPDEQDRRALLDEFITQLRDDLEPLTPTAHDRPWVREVARFYGMRGAHAKS